MSRCGTAERPESEYSLGSYAQIFAPMPSAVKQAHKKNQQQLFTEAKPLGMRMDAGSKVLSGLNTKHGTEKP